MISTTRRRELVKHVLWKLDVSEHWEQLDRLADALLHQETVEDDDLVSILGERPLDTGQ